MTPQYSKDSANPEVTSLATDVIFRHTCQILERGGKYNYKPRGSGVLVTIDENYYILTASHVVKSMSEEEIPLLFIPTSVGVMPLRGDYEYSDLSIDLGIDVAYIKLDMELVRLIEKNNVFLPKKKIWPRYVPDDVLYLTMGFPVVNIKAEGNIIRAGAEFFLQPHSKQKVYDHYKLSQETHFVLDFSGKGTSLYTNEKRKVNSEPHGMSGCGLWMIGDKMPTNELPPDYFLIGIMTEYKKGKYHVLIGNNIGLITHGIMESE